MNQSLSSTATMTAASAPSPTPEPALVELWWLDSRFSHADADRLERMLVRSERDHLARLRLPEIRRRQRFFRARTREILGQWLGRDPAKLVFTLGPHGKPSLTLEDAPAFNLTHAGDFGLLAVTTAPAIGIDLEDRNRPVEHADLAERFFAPDEVTALRALDGDRRREGFFNAWVRKEAWIKALGTGLITPLDDFTVSLDSDRGEGWMLDTGPTGVAAEWTFLTPGPLPEEGFAAALAVRAPAARLRWR